MLAIFKRELRSCFHGMIGAVLTAFMLAATAIYFVALNLGYGLPDFGYYTLCRTIFVLLLYIPVLTMRSFAEERHSRTDQLLLTSPVSVGGIVLGKYFALCVIFALPCLVDAGMIDLFKTLSDHEEQLYYRRDSHWNMRGAQLAAQTLLKELKGSEAEFDSCINGKTSPHTGDLYEMVYPAGNETEQDTAYDFTYQYDEKFHSADDITIHTENSAADESIFVYRDSFGINLHPFLAQSYGNACFSRNMPYRLTAVTEEHPDVLLVERNLNWLLERAPEMPAPERTAVPAADTGTSAKAQRKDSRMEGTFCLTGDLSGQRVDDDSPIYILAETETYEASPCGEGTQPFTAYLPQNMREQQLKAAFLSDGEWVFCALAD